MKHKVNVPCKLVIQPRQLFRVLATILFMYTCGVSADIEIELCLPAVNNQPCNITCRIPDFTEIIDFQCNGSSRGMCHIIFCSPNIIKKKNNTFHLQIPSLSYSNDGCEWNCKYGRNVSPSAKLTIFSGFTSGLVLTGQHDSTGVKLTATADCLYPYYPFVDIMYSYQIDGQFKLLHRQADILQTSAVPKTCSSDIEKTITAIFYVSGHLSELKGKTVFFSIRFLQYVNGTSSFTNVAGPFSFEEDEILESNSEYKYILYGISAILCISIAVNGCTIIWILRQRLRKKQVTRGNKNDESPNNDPIPHTGIYDIPEDNAGYQELSHVTGRSHYDQLQRPN